MSQAMDELMALVNMETYLQYDFFPPHPVQFAPFCIKAIEMYNEEKGDEFVPGIVINDEPATAKWFINEFNLGQFCNGSE